MYIHHNVISGMICADEEELNMPKRKGDGSDKNIYIYWWFRFTLEIGK